MSTVNAIRGPSATVATSSSNTPYSGTSNYRMESFKPFPGAKASPSPVADGRQVIRIHFEELSIFLANHMAKGIVFLCDSMLYDVCLGIRPNIISILIRAGGGQNECTGEVDASDAPTISRAFHRCIR